MSCNEIQSTIVLCIVASYYSSLRSCTCNSEQAGFGVAWRDEARARRDGTKVRETVLVAPIDFLEHLIWLKSRNTFSDSEIHFFVAPLVVELTVLRNECDSIMPQLALLTLHKHRRFRKQRLQHDALYKILRML